MQLDDWIFGHAVLLGGLRQYLSAPGLRLLDVKDAPAPAVLPGSAGDSANRYRLRPFTVDLELDGSQHQMALTLHEAPQHAIAREFGLYRSLAPHLPIIVPGFIAGDPLQGWLVLEGLDDLRAPQNWTVDDYRELVDNLATLHDRFWALEEDLDNFDWLWRPLHRDYATLKLRIDSLVQKLLEITLPEPFHTDRFRATLEALNTHLDSIADILRGQTQTLLHGDYWAGNIARPLDGRQMVTRWHCVGIGPAALDVVMYYQNTTSFLKPVLPLDAAVTRYRVKLHDLQGHRIWADEEWEETWDYALMWLFAVHWIERLAELSPRDESGDLLNRLNTIWLAPVQQALERRIKIKLPD